MPLQDLTTPPTAPARTNDSETFITRADAFVAWFATFVSEMNTLATQLEASAALINAAPAYADAMLTAMADGNTPAADKLCYLTGATTSEVTDFTAVARTLVAQTTQALMRTAGLGLSANGSSLVSAADYAAMRTLLGLVIGTDVQAYDAELAALAGLTSAADKGIQFTGAGTAGLFDLTAFAKTLLDDADATAARATLGVLADATSTGTATSGYMDIPTTGLGTIRVNWGRTTVGANSTSTPSLAGSYTTALVGGGQAMSSSTSDTDASYCHLSSTTAMTIANGTDGSLTFQWWAIGVV